MDYASKQLEMNFHLYIMGFNIYELSLFLCLSGCPPVCARSNSRNYFSNVLKLRDAINIRYRMKHIENVMHGVKDSSTEVHKSFPIH